MSPVPGTLHVLGGQRVYLAGAEGPLLGSERDALELVGETYGARPDWIALPVARCGEAFFQLRTRTLGDVVQKLVNYGLRVAFVGDVSAQAAGSEALRDFVREANRGRQVWFVASLAELAERLERESGAGATPASPSRS